MKESLLFFNLYFLVQSNPFFVYMYYLVFIELTMMNKLGGFPSLNL